MATCGCADLTGVCMCQLVNGLNTTVVGSGSTATPWQVNVVLPVQRVFFGSINPNPPFTNDALTLGETRNDSGFLVTTPTATSGTDIIVPAAGTYQISADARFTGGVAGTDEYQLRIAGDFNGLLVLPHVRVPVVDPSQQIGLNISMAVWWPAAGGTVRLVANAGDITQTSENVISGNMTIVRISD